jgi:hypothetical protein
MELKCRKLLENAPKLFTYPVRESGAWYLSKGVSGNYESSGQGATLLQGAHSLQESVTLVINGQETEEGGHRLPRLQVRNCVQSSLLSLQIRNCIRSSGK